MTKFTTDDLVLHDSAGLCRVVSRIIDGTVDPTQTRYTLDPIESDRRATGVTADVLTEPTRLQRQAFGVLDKVRVKDWVIAPDWAPDTPLQLQRIKGPHGCCQINDKALHDDGKYRRHHDDAQYDLMRHAKPREMIGANIIPHLPAKNPTPCCGAVAEEGECAFCGEGVEGEASDDTFDPAPYYLLDGRVVVVPCIFHTGDGREGMAYHPVTDESIRVATEGELETPDRLHLQLAGPSDAPGGLLERGDIRVDDYVVWQGCGPKNDVEKVEEVRPDEGDIKGEMGAVGDANTYRLATPSELRDAGVEPPAGETGDGGDPLFVSDCCQADTSVRETVDPGDARYYHCEKCGEPCSIEHAPDDPNTLTECTQCGDRLHQMDTLEAHDGRVCMTCAGERLMVGTDEPDPDDHPGAALGAIRRLKKALDSAHRGGYAHAAAVGYAACRLLDDAAEEMFGGGADDTKSTSDLSTLAARESITEEDVDPDRKPFGEALRDATGDEFDDVDPIAYTRWQRGKITTREALEQGGVPASMMPEEDVDPRGSCPRCGHPRFDLIEHVTRTRRASFDVVGQLHRGDATESETTIDALRCRGCQYEWSPAELESEGVG